MYYQNLKNIKEEPNIKKMIHQELLDEIIDKLDIWLISMNDYKTLRLNPKEFGIDKNVKFLLAKKIFLSGYKKEIFDMYFEVRTDENEFLDRISYEEYLSVISGKNISFYSIDKDKNIDISPHNIEIWFQLLISPSNLPSSFTKNLESEVPALSGNDLLGDDVDWISR